MKIRNWLCLYLCVTVGVWAHMAYAQLTPRDSIIGALELQKSGLLDQKKATPTEQPVKPDPKKTKHAQTPITSEAQIPIETFLKAKPKESIDRIQRTRAPFYLSAEEYLQLGRASGEVMVLTYDVQTVSPYTNPQDDVKRVILILGPDYAAIETSKGKRIYDFKFNRLLTISTDMSENTNAIFFENISLYAKSYRNLVMACQASASNIRNKAVDAFWVDSVLGFAVQDISADLVIGSDDDRVKAVYKNEEVAHIIASNTQYVSEAYKNVFFAFLHHEIPLHPLIILPTYAYDGPPKSITLMALNPGTAEEVKQVWTLKTAVSKPMSFPLLPSTKSALQRELVAPLAYVVNLAARDKALGGSISKDSLIKEYDRAFLAREYMIAWVLGRRYHNRFGPCQKQNPYAICSADEAIRDLTQSGFLETERPQDENLQNLIKILDMFDEPQSRIEGLKLYLPYMDDKSVPAFVDRAAAMARTTVKLDPEENANLAALSPDAMLRQALAKDPYDAHSYLALAQVLAANGAYEQAWDIYDAMRDKIPGGQTLAVKINRFEANLRKTAPAFFPPGL